MQRHDDIYLDSGLARVSADTLIMASTIWPIGQAEPTFSLQALR